MSLIHRLSIIFALFMTVFFVGIYGLMQVSKGSNLHRLNGFHMLGIINMSDMLNEMSQDNETQSNALVNKLSVLEKEIRFIREQPLECLKVINAVDMMIMSLIGTTEAYNLCITDLAKTDAILEDIKRFKQNQIDQKTLVHAFYDARDFFTDSSRKFSHPVEKTVNFIGKTMSDLLVGISLLAAIVLGFIIKGISKNETQLRTYAQELESKTGALAESEKKSRAVIDGSADTIITINQYGIIQSFNPAGEKMFGYKADEVLGQNIKLLMPAPYTSKHDGYLKRYLGTGEKRMIGSRREVSALRKDGSELPVQIGISEIVLGEEKLFIGTVRDITDEKAAKKKIQKDAETLQAKNIELSEKGRIAEAANYAKSRFLATMSHEIRTPLNGVVGMSELLRNTGLTSKQMKYANTINSSAEVLLSIIGDVLDFSKIEAGEMDINPVAMNLYRQIKEMMSVLNAAAEEHNVEFVFQYDPEIPMAIKLDPVRIKQMILNLVGNAIKFTEDGYVIVSVRQVGKNADGTIRLRLEVTDSGIGIPLEKQTQIFENFTQADTSTTRNYGGTGLGLAICRKLTELMKGEIGVESTVGRGSTFWFEIPTMEAEDTEDTKQPMPQSPDTLTCLNTQKVLVVDDFAPNREVISGYLESWGIEHETISSGAQALTEIKKSENEGTPYTLGIIDYMMPEMDGEELAKVIHARSESKDMKLIMVTAAYKIKDANCSQAMGFSHCILKPIYASELMDAMLDIVQHGQSQAAHAGVEQDAILATVTMPDGSKPKILVAEDSRVNQMFAEEILLELGCEPEIAVNGALAFEQYQNNDYDLILMDCMMPEMDGYDATQMIREFENDNKSKKIIIVAMTANAMEGDRERCIDAGMDDYIAKPARREDIKSMLEKYLA